MNLESKIRFTLPEYIYNIIMNDEKDFNLNKNKLCNIIFKIYHKKVNWEENLLKTNYNKILQFNLTNDNKDIFEDISSRKDIKNKAEYFRKVFFMYCDQPKYKRELILFEKTINFINLSRKSKKKLKIKYNDEYRIIEPYFIINSDGETRNYIFSYCEKNKDHRNYRLINIKAISIMEESFERYDERYIDKIKNNFDPFLSYGQKIIIKLSEKGKKHFEKVIVNKPKIMEEKEDIFILECSILKAKLYFPQFLDEVEIIEPLELREWFKLKYENCIKKYI